MTKVVSVERLVLTQAMIDNHPYRKKPWCRLCSDVIRWKKHSSWGIETMRRKQYVPTFLKVGEQVVKVTYTNHAVTYCHQECYDKREKGGVKTE